MALKHKLEGRSIGIFGMTDLGLKFLHKLSIGTNIRHITNLGTIAIPIF